jgi:Protein of unknown function (DUF2971)
MMYRILPPKYGVKSLISGMLKLGNVLEFNDPYDSLLSLTHPDPRVPQSKLDEGAAKQRALQFGSYGILCLTENPESTCTWAHYAQNHTGLALGFDLDISRSDLIKIKYLTSRPYLDIARPLEPNTDETTQRIMTCLETKSPDWEYESERRLIVRENDPQVLRRRLSRNDSRTALFIPMPPELRVVILGYKCSAGDEALVRKTINNRYGNKVRIMRCALSSVTFSFEITN